MKKIIASILLSIVFLGCASSNENTQNQEPKLLVGKKLSHITLNDQFDKPQTMPNDTTTLIFAFSKPMGHLCNDFFARQSPTYLDDNKAIFIADISEAPSLIRSMFIIPGLKEFHHTVLILDNEDLAQEYKVGMDTDKIAVVSIKDGIITAIKTASTPNELKALIQH